MRGWTERKTEREKDKYTLLSDREKDRNREIDRQTEEVTEPETDK